MSRKSPAPSASAPTLPLTTDPTGASTAAVELNRDLIARVVDLATEVGRLRAAADAGPQAPAEVRAEAQVEGATAAARLFLATLAGEQVPVPRVPAVREAVERARDLRAAAVGEPANGADRDLAARQAVRVVGLFERAAQTGEVPDDLPPSPHPLRDALQAVADLRRAAIDADARASAARAETLDAQKAARRHHEELRALREAAPPVPTDAALAAKVAELEAASAKAARERDGAKRALDLAKQEVAHLKPLANRTEEAERQSADLRAALALIAEAAQQPANLSPADLAQRVAEALAAIPTPEPVPALQPPPMREAAWTELQPGQLALDRRSLRRLQDMHATADGPEPTDPQRRVLALRVGNHVAWLRGDGLWSDGTPFEEGQLFKPARFRDWLSPRALVIAEGLSGDPGEVAAAFRAWVEAARLCPGLDVVLADDLPADVAAQAE